MRTYLHLRNPIHTAPQTSTLSPTVVQL